MGEITPKKFMLHDFNFCATAGLHRPSGLRFFWSVQSATRQRGSLDAAKCASAAMSSLLTPITTLLIIGSAPGR
jgi:hypothetical protein